jgi:hypothetical protein
MLTSSKEVSMARNASLVTRIAVGKTIGLIVGLVGFFMLPALYPDVSWQLRWGVVLWYVTVGAVVGMAGVFTHHPVLMLPMPWWVRAPLIGAWMNFVLTFFAYREMTEVMTRVFGPDGTLSSPFWFVAEGAIIAAIMGYCATRVAGEGRETVDG